MSAVSNPPGRLSGQVALVTGASSGIGQATAVALAAAGASVSLLGRRRDALEECAGAVELAGAAALVQVADVTDVADVEAAVAATLERFGRVDLLVNNAGVNPPRRLWADTTLDDWNYVVDTDLTGLFICTRAVLPAMRAQRSGLVVNVSSGAGRRASLISGVAYSAAKHGVVALTQMINLEEWERGIRATTVYPGEVDTPIMETRPAPPPRAARDLMLKAEDVAAAIVFVATLPDRAVVEDLVIYPRARR